MDYILKVLPAIPAASAVSALIDYLIFRRNKEKWKNKSLGQKTAEYLLTGWSVMFVYVTQIMSFGNGLGALFNLRPLRMFYIAYRYGTVNASGVWQFLLNIFMFVPLGILLPIVFPRFRSWPKVTAASFFTSLATELLQLLSRRGTDIDDVIANTAGGMCGFALLVLFSRIYEKVSGKKTAFFCSGRRIILSMAVLFLTAVPFIGLKLSDGSSKYGNLYYGHLVPDSLNIQCVVNDQGKTRTIYKYVEKESLQQLETRLQKDSGIQGSWKMGDGTDTLAELDREDGSALFIFPWHTWTVRYSHPASAGSVLPKEKLVDLAWKELNRFGIREQEVAFREDDSEEYGDDLVYLVFQSTEDTDDRIVYGDITVSLTPDGYLAGIYDTRRWCGKAGQEECISAAESLEIAGDVGVGAWHDQAMVTGVTEGYAFLPETGYLIPTWEIKGYLNRSDGTTMAWNPEIDAVKR